MIPVEQRSHSALPNFGLLSSAALASNLLLSVGLLGLGLGHAVVSVMAGWMVGLVVYGTLYLFVGRGLDPFVSRLRGKAKPSTAGQTLIFGLMLPVKYLALGLLIWLIWRTGQLNLLWFSAGFIVTQISVTAATVAHMARCPRN
jgi:hypothetical protein